MCGTDNYANGRSAVSEERGSRPNYLPYLPILAFVFTLSSRLTATDGAITQAHGSVKMGEGGIVICVCRREQVMGHKYVLNAINDVQRQQAERGSTDKSEDKYWIN